MMSADLQDEEFLLQNVQDLRQRLQLTEQSLANLNSLEARAQPVHHGFVAPSRPQDVTGPRQSPPPSDRSSPPPDPLTIEDLTPESTTRENEFLTRVQDEFSDGIQMHSSPLLQKGPTERTSNHRSAKGSKTLQFGNADDFEQENETLRLKLKQLREENSQLVAQNHKLLNQVENSGFEQRQNDLKVKSLTTEVSLVTCKVKELLERIACLESENKSSLDALKEAEERVESCQQQMRDRDAEMERLTDENQNLNEELNEVYRLKKRAENDRDFALQSAEEIQDSYEEFQQKAEEKFQKFHVHEEQLQIRADAMNAEIAANKEELKSVKSHSETLQADIRSLQKENVTQKSSLSALEQLNEELSSRLTKASSKIGTLESDVLQKKALGKENEELRAVVEQQKLKLSQCRTEIGESRAHLSQLSQLAEKLQEKSRSVRERDSGVSSKGTQKNLSGNEQNTFDLDGSYLQNFSGGEENRSQILEMKKKLSLAETEILHLRELLDRRKSEGDVPSTIMENLKRELKSMTERSKMAEKREEELENIIKKLEEDRKKHTSQLVILEERLSEFEVNASSLDSRLSHRNSQVSDLQAELSENSNQITNLEREIRKKNSQLASLERQLDEKVIEVTEHVAKVGELEEALQVMVLQMQRAQMELEERSSEHLQQTAMVDKMKQLHTEQCQELERQIEILDRRRSEKDSRLDDIERKLAFSQQLLDEKESVLTETKMELDRIRCQGKQSMKGLEDKARDASEKVAHLQSALAMCQEELRVHIDQLDESRSLHDKALEEKDRQLEKLEKQVDDVRKASQSKDSRALEAEKCLTERQEMLQQSNNRVAELEDTQSRLEMQISRLEQELHREKVSLGTELTSANGKLHQACADLELKERELGSLKSKLNAMQDEKDQLLDQVHYLEEQLQEEGRELAGQGERTRQLERDLRSYRSQLRDKEDNVKDLEDSVKRYQDEMQEKSQRCKELYDELQKAQSELLISGSKTSETEQTVKSLEQDLKQRNDQIEMLQHTIRRNQDEIRSRNQELEDLNIALKERQWELQQRANQITQLDMTINDYRAEMEQKMIRMEVSLKKAQLEGQQRTNQVSSMDESVKTLQVEVQEKEVKLQQADMACRKYRGDLDIANQQIDQLTKQMEAIHRQLENVHLSGDDMEKELQRCREEMQRMHYDLTECRRELSMSKREQDRLSRDLEQASNNIKIKELEIQKSAQQLGILKAKEEQTGSKYSQEIKQLKAEIDSLQEDHEQEINEIQDSHNRIASNKEQIYSQHRIQMQEARDKEAIYRTELEKAHALIARLEADLSACKGTIDAANEAILLKDAELARMQAKVSSLQRAALTSDTSQVSMQPAGVQHPASVNNSSLSTGSNASSLYLSRMSFVKLQRNPPPEGSIPEPVQHPQQHVSFQEPIAQHHQPQQMRSDTQESASDKLHMQYLNVKLANMKDLVDDTSQLQGGLGGEVPGIQGQVQQGPRVPAPAEEPFMPLVSDTSNGSSMSSRLNRTEDVTFSAPVPVVPTFTRSHPPRGVVRPKFNYPPPVPKPVPSIVRPEPRVPSTGIVGALDLSVTDPGDPDSLMGMLREIKKNTSTGNNTLNSTSSFPASRKGKSAKNRLFEPTASFKAKTVTSENQKRQERIEKLAQPKGRVKQFPKPQKGKTTLGQEYAPVLPQKDLSKPPKKSSPKFATTDNILDVSTAIAHYSTNQSNNNYCTETGMTGMIPSPQQEPLFSHNVGNSPFKSYQAAGIGNEDGQSADALLMDPGQQENISNGEVEVPRLVKAESFPDGLDISAITDDSTKPVSYMDSVNYSHPNGPRMSTANNTQIGTADPEAPTDTSSCMAQLQLRRLAIQQRQSELNSQLAAADAQLEQPIEM